MNVLLLFGGAVVLLTLGVGLQNVAAQEGVIVEIPGQGRVQSGYDTTTWTNAQILTFLGIPYAESPSGTRRFKAPVARSAWSDIHNGTVFGKKCPSLTVLEEYSKMTDTTYDVEDCLTLSVYTKDVAASLPVMVYMTGESFLEGSAEEYKPNYLLNEEVVLVVVQYRFGPLGFLTTNTDDLPGNVGMADAIMALEWVQKNIEQFGGNKNLVTLFGQSAGAWMASGLLATPVTENKNLFHRVIVQSGNILSHWEQETQLLTQGQRICSRMNCADCVTPADIYKCVKDANLLDLWKASMVENFAPKIGDRLGIFPEHPYKLLEKSTRAIPVMTGFTKQEGAHFLEKYYNEALPASGTFADMTVRDFATGLIDRVNDTSGVTSDALLRLAFDYTPGILDVNDHKNAVPGYIDIASILFTKSAVINMAKTIAAKNTAKVYLYTFDYLGNHTRFSTEETDSTYPYNGGVNHSHDNIYLFAPHVLDEKDTVIAKKMTALWTSFALNGVPTGLTDDMAIPAMSSDIGPYFHINEAITEGLDVLQELTVTLDDPNKRYFGGSV